MKGVKAPGLSTVSEIYIIVICDTVWASKARIHEALSASMTDNNGGKLTEVGSNFTVVLARAGSTTPRKTQSSNCPHYMGIRSCY